jgi:hypothetical protein
MQRPNLSYGETKIFDKYYNTLFKNEYLPKDIYALAFWMNKIMDAWTLDNPLGLNEDILTMKAYAPYHMLYAISAICAKCNNQTSVPSPSECLRLAQENNNIVDSVVQIAAMCLNNAIETEKNNTQTSDKTFIPQNWVKSKASMFAINGAVINCFSFNPNAKNLIAALKMDQKHFSYRVQADD